MDTTEGQDFKSDIDFGTKECEGLRKMLKRYQAWRRLKETYCAKAKVKYEDKHFWMLDDLWRILKKG